MAKVITKSAPAKPVAKKAVATVADTATQKEAKMVQEGDLQRRIKPSYRWIAADVVREAGTEPAETEGLITACHKAAKAAGLEPKEDAYWGRRLTRARSLLRKAGLGVYKGVRMAPPKSEKPAKKTGVAKKKASVPDDVEEA